MGRIDWKTFDKSIIYKYYIEENLSYDEASKKMEFLHRRLEDCVTSMVL